MIAMIDKRIARFVGGIRQAFRGVVTLVKAASSVQLLQVDGLAGEQLQDNELFQHYGYTSNPPAGTMAIVLPVGGKTAHGIIIATEHGTYRLKGLASGEVALYSDEGDSVVLKRGRLIEVTTQTLRINTVVMEVNASSHINLNTPMVTCSEQATVQQRLTGNGSLTITNISGTGGASSVEGPLSQTGGSFTSDMDVVANGISLHDHHHNGTQPGAGSTGVAI
jgi:phage baseplate assembly protein V